MGTPFGIGEQQIEPLRFCHGMGCNKPEGVDIHGHDGNALFCLPVHQIQIPAGFMQHLPFL